MTLPTRSFPCCRAVAEHAVLVEFGEVISHEINNEVRRLDAALAARRFAGFTQAVPAYASLLVGFDPQVTDHAETEAAVLALLAGYAAASPCGIMREVLVCYDADLAPDLDEVASSTQLPREEVIAAHLAGDYSVFLYGFAPGYAYLGGISKAIQLPRKPAAVRGIPAGSVLIAGPQCLVTTLTMPTGWWIIGRSPTQVLSNDPVRPFLFDVGDKVKFRRIDRPAFDALQRQG